jgi:uncharacterized protein YqjF (DUF2071 family)
VTTVNAPAGDIDRLRRPLRLGHLRVTLTDLLIATWRVPEAELRRHLPRTLEPVIDDGGCYISAVVFRNRALRPAVTGFPRLRSSQMNVRVYVRAPGSLAAGSVFFLGLYLSRPWMAGLSSSLFGVPFRYLPLEVTARNEGHGVEWHARSPDDRVSLHAREADAAVDPHTLDLLTNPHTGYFLDRRGVLRRWSIWHRPQAVKTMAVQQARIESLRGFSISRPLPALYVQSADYEVYLPPIAAS